MLHILWFKANISNRNLGTDFRIYLNFFFKFENVCIFNNFKTISSNNSFSKLQKQKRHRFGYLVDTRVVQ